MASTSRLLALRTASHRWMFSSSSSSSLRMMTLAKTWNVPRTSAATLSTLAATATAGGQQHTQQQNQQRWIGVAAATALAAAAASTTIFAAQRPSEKTDCCGIAAVVGSGDFDARSYLLEGLTVLKNRGCDSLGLATMDPKGGPMTITKYAVGERDNPDQVLDKLKRTTQHAHGPIGMAHTRFATHGGRLDENAHPHVSGKIALVHNGVLHNARVLRRQLEGFGHTFVSQTDSEVIVKLIDYYYEKLLRKQKEAGAAATDKHLLKTATEKALAQCDGTWGLVVMCQDVPDEVVVACNGSPLLIGMTSTGGNEDNVTTIQNQATYIASEVGAFRKYTQTFVALKDGEVGVVKATGPILDTWSRVRLEQLDTQYDQEEFKMAPTIPEPFPDWTLKEIYEQPEALGRALGFGARLTGAGKVSLGGLDAERERLEQVEHLILSGVGTSLHAAKYGALLMKLLGCMCTVQAIDAVELNLHDFPYHSPPNHTACCVLSQSGETKDSYRAVETAMDGAQVPTLSVTNGVGSSIARKTKLGVYCHAGRENAIVSSKGFTAQITVMAMIALWFRQIKEERDPSTKNQHSMDEVELLKESLMRLPMAFGMALKNHDKCKAIAAGLQFTDTCFVLGKGFGEPIAQQGAFKMQELGSLHAEGLAAGSLKHASLALIEPPILYRQRLKTRMVGGKRKKTEKMKTTKKKNVAGTPVFCIILDDQHSQSVRQAAMEVKARGGHVIVITDKPELATGLDDDPLLIPHNGPLTALSAVVPLQLIAYELAKVRGINPDAPRNLSKAILVH